ncbi:MAG: DUF5519 family protein [Bacteroidetes bacterium]|nr:DUF5519 family protein [Bacteroidota bacterium]
MGRRQIGHIHGNRLVDIPFPMSVRNELVEAGTASPHHVLPESGWISFYLRAPEDIGTAIALLRRSYDVVIDVRARRTAGAAIWPSTEG